MAAIMAAAEQDEPRSGLARAALAGGMADDSRRPEGPPQAVAADAAGWRAEYAASPELQAEFETAGDYVALKCAESGGLLKAAAIKESVQRDPLAGMQVGGDDAAWRAEFAGSEALQAEFIRADLYCAYRRGVAAGVIR
jgi:hypothetical protein